MAMKKVRLLVRYGHYANEVPPPEAPRPWGVRLLLVGGALIALAAAWARAR